MRVGLLTSGGDCQALNAAMRGVVKGLFEYDKKVEIFGFRNGYKGLIYKDYTQMSRSDFSGILTRGGTILGSSRSNLAESITGSTSFESSSKRSILIVSGR